MRWIAGSSSAGCWLGTTEPEKQRQFARMVKRSFVVFDLGANVGHYSLLASLLVGPDGRVFCFEPVQRNLAFLRKHIELNRLTNCTVWDAAVGRTEGVAAFDPDSTPFTGHLTEKRDGAVLVKSVALDKLVASGELPPPDLIKCDIEGGEFDALSGASATLDKYGPAIFLATHSPEVHQKCCKLLTSLGYHLTSVDNAPIEETRELVAVRQSA